jgi:hypothetical protein
MRVFDRHSDAASFWYLRRCKQREVDTAAAAVWLPIVELESLSSSLKLVRDKTHFHIDKKAVFDPKAPWQQANIKGPEFVRPLQGAFDVLNHLHRARWRDDFWLPDYDGSDASAIAKFSESLRDGQQQIVDGRDKPGHDRIG